MIKEKIKNFFKRNEYRYTTKDLIGHDTANGMRVSGATTTGGSFVSISDMTRSSVISSLSSDQAVTKVKKDKRKKVNPIDVFKEVEIEDIEISFDNLEEKIKAVTERVGILKEHLDEDHFKDEYKTVFYLQNRLKYLKLKKKHPLDWAMTNHDAIADLCTRYKLRKVPLKQYYTLVPKAGIDEIAWYTKQYKAIVGDDPIFELIIKDDVKTEKKDRDPILLANSPLGNFYFVLGAWDDEVEIVDEIIYGNK